MFGLPKGVSISIAEEKRVTDGLEALSKDPHAPREISVSLTLHVHNEYPKLLYKGKDSVTVADEAGEEKAIADGFGKFSPEGSEPKADPAPEVVVEVE